MTARNRDRGGPQGYLSVAAANKAEQKLTFLALPAEIRMQIYDLLLVSRFDREEIPSWAVRKAHQKMVVLHMTRAPRYRTMEPSILQTCKQVYHEAIVILYSRNVFAISAPKQMFSLMSQIGPTNTKFVRFLKITVPWRTEISPWLKLLHTLSKTAVGLKFLELGWGAEREFP